jgi:hypothetical protein
LCWGTDHSKARRYCATSSANWANSVECAFVNIPDGIWSDSLHLARIGKEQALLHPQGYIIDRVEGAIQALGLIGTSKAAGTLLKALEDEDSQIRSLAALNLVKVVKKESLPHLLGVVQSKDFYKRDKVEIKAFFDAIGMIGSNEAIQPLQKLLEQKSWFESGRKVEIRQGAANALALIGTPEAKSILQSGTNSREQMSVKPASRR